MEKIHTMNNRIKSALTYAGILLFFALLSYGFMPALFSGKVVNQSDTSAWKGMTHEISEHNAAHPDDKTYWTNSMFGGMPGTAMYDDFDGDWTKPLYKAFLLGMRPANYLLISLVGGFLLMLAFGVRRVLAVAGAIAVSFCSYNMQIIQVGHNTKMQAIAFMPYVLAGIVFTYRAALDGLKRDDKTEVRKAWKEWLPKVFLGAVLFALALSMQIKANHPQITYYLAIIIFVYALSQLAWLCLKPERRTLLGRFFAASAILLIVGVVGICTNLNKLIPTYEYTAYTMRGGSELSSDSDSHNDRGLDLDYATAWSYGIEEMPNLLIANYNGGASAGELSRESETYKLLKRAGQPGVNNIIKSMPLYWGPQPFTAGPMYMGAVTVFLFILGLCLCRGREKWWIIIASIIAIFLAWGNHFLWFTRLWFDYAPMYNKFRTVSMALVVLQLTLPVLAFIVLERIFREEYDGRQVIRGLGMAYAVTAGFCLLCTLFPAIAGDFRSPADAGYPEMLADALAEDRKGLLVKDALRSLVMITLCCAAILWAYSGKSSFRKDSKGNSVPDGVLRRAGRLGMAGLVIIALVLFDLWGVDKRYLNSGHFMSKRDFSGQFEPRDADKIIKEDKDLDYRVLDVSVNTFNDSHQSYHHKCIGGYSPAKMQRYQDLIDRYLTSEINRFIKTVNDEGTISGIEANMPYLPILSMLNCKYMIVDGDYPPIVNKYAFGDAWFVDNVAVALTPDEEIAMLAEEDLRHTAIISKEAHHDMQMCPPSHPESQTSHPELGSGSPSRDADNKQMLNQVQHDSIEMTHYAANELRYHFASGCDQVAVFSQIYYPAGWKAWLEPNGEYGEVKDGRYRPTEDARELTIYDADWLLRALYLPEGEGEIIMRFEPDSYLLGERLSRASSITLLLLLLLSLGGIIIRRK